LNPKAEKSSTKEITIAIFLSLFIPNFFTSLIKTYRGYIKKFRFCWWLCSSLWGGKNVEILVRNSLSEKEKKEKEKRKEKLRPLLPFFRQRARCDYA
jgi:hypothetical protein